MKKTIVLLALVFILALAFASAPAEAYSPACWGQASAAFAQMGEMGAHASEQEEPRDGLGVLAVLLYDDGSGPLDAPTLPALGAFLVDSLGLSVEACMD